MNTNPYGLLVHTGPVRVVAGASRRASERFRVAIWVGRIVIGWVRAARRLAGR